jgi:DNA-binding transcriptional ArsR family regulator
MNDAIVCLENLFLGLGDKTRLKLLALMAGGPVSVGYLVQKTGDSQPKVSRHLAYLRNAGLVETRREGMWIYYAVAAQEDPQCDAVLRSVLDQLGGSAQPISEPESEVVWQNNVAGDRYSTADEIEDSVSLETVEADDDSVDRRDELDVFLL